MIIGAYYRCPIVVEPGDKDFPRFFVLAQAVEYNELADGVVVKMHDLLGSSAYYADLLTHTIFPAKSLDRCEAMIGGAVSCKGGRGRIICRSRKTDDPDQPYWYWIRLNSGKTIELPETDIKLDYSQMNYAPEKQLKSYEFQHPTWFVNHMKVSKNLHIINNAIYGFEVLAGCRAYLMPHQISTVARCFETMPVRYMLADEVGLGKTVEACSILSILLSNNRELKTLIIAPGALVGQWKNELHYKYGLRAKEKSIDGDVCIIPLEDMVNEWVVSAISWDLVVVDETHRLLGDDILYGIVQLLSRTATHILLLSATPIQERNEEYRRLLALLSPDQYSEMSKEQFASLVKKQSRVQKAVNQQIKRLSRYDEYSEEIIEKLEQIAEMLEDRTFSKLVGNIDVSSEDRGLEQVQEALSYVCENYRIERRVIRNRRQFIRERMAKRTLEAIPYRPLSLSENYNELGIIQDTMAYLADQGEDEDYARDVAIPLLNALFSSPWAYQDMLKKLRIDDPRLVDGADIWAKQAEGEHRNVNSILDEDPDLIKGRLLKALDYIDQETDLTTDETFKMVVFTSHKATLDAFDELFRQRYDSQDIYAAVFGAGMSRDDLEESVYLFQNDPNCRAIICDETGGEGRNFQNARLVLHLDLPWNANALEQRIGRLDRLGRDADEDVLSVVLYAQGTVEEQLFLIWQDGLKLFEESLSGLEIITGELNQLIVEALTDDYYFGLKNAFEDIMDQAEEMREAVEDEKDFDLGATLYSPMMDGVDRTLSLYEQEDGNLFAEAMMSWAAQAGLHGRRGHDEGLIEFADNSFSVNAARQSLLVPPDWSTYDDSFLMKREGKIVGTFDRGIASLREDILFYAPGDSLYDAIISNSLGCSRGRCSAIWTQSEINYDGLIFIYNIVPQIPALLEAGIDLQTLSQYRMYLPLEQIVIPIALGVASQDVPEKTVLEIIERLNVSNAKHLGKRGAGRFGSSAMEQFIRRFPPNAWEPLVDKCSAIAMKRAEIKLKEEADIATAKNEMQRIINGYRSECLYFGRDMGVVERFKEIYSKTLKALAAAKPVLDAVCYLRVRINDK